MPYYCVLHIDGMRFKDDNNIAKAICTRQYTAIPKHIILHLERAFKDYIIR